MLWVWNRDTVDADIEKIVLPDNHPFAVKKKVSKLYILGSQYQNKLLSTIWRKAMFLLKRYNFLQVSKDEEDLIKARLAVKRGLPLQDLQGTRGLPDDAFRRATQQR
jgi:hypothetical protein